MNRERRALIRQVSTLKSWLKNEVDDNVIFSLKKLINLYGNRSAEMLLASDTERESPMVYDRSLKVFDQKVIIKQKDLLDFYRLASNDKDLNADLLHCLNFDPYRSESIMFTGKDLSFYLNKNLVKIRDKRAYTLMGEKEYIDIQTEQGAKHLLDRFVALYLILQSQPNATDGRLPNEKEAIVLAVVKRTKEEHVIVVRSNGNGTDANWSITSLPTTRDRGENSYFFSYLPVNKKS